MPKRSKSLFSLEVAYSGPAFKVACRMAVANHFEALFHALFDSCLNFTYPVFPKSPRPTDVTGSNTVELPTKTSKHDDAHDGCAESCREEEVMLVT